MKLPLLIAVLATMFPLTWGAPAEIGRITRLGDASYGSSIDASGNLAVIGNRTRAVDIGQVEPRTVELLRRDSATGAWSRVTLLTAPEPGRYFGWSVAVDGDFVAVGAPSILSSGQGQPNSDLNGRVYVYSRNTGGTDNWGLARTIEGSSQGTGMHVALSGTTLAVGTPAYLAEVVPAIRIHERNQGGSGNWGVSATVPMPAGGGSKGSGNYRFGTNFDLHGDTLLIGAMDDFTGNDQAWVHLRNQGGAENWGLFQTLTPYSSDERVGLRVAVHGGRLALTGVRGGNQAFIRLYAWNVGGGALDVAPYIMNTAIDEVADRRVALSEDGFATLDRRANGDLRVRVRRWSGATGYENTILAERIIGREERSAIPYALAMTRDAVLAGADRIAGDPPSHGAGIVRPLDRNTGGPDQFGLLPPLTPSLVGGGTFGKAMAMRDNYMIAGDPDASAGGVTRGAAYLFRRRSSEEGVHGEAWTLVARIGPDAPSSDNAKFGSSVAIGLGGAILIGAPGESGGGAAYLYRLSELNHPEFVTSFTRSLSTGDIRFGAAVAVINSAEMLIGAPGSDTGGTNSGAVFYYRAGAGGTWTSTSLPRTDPDGNPAGDQFGNALSFANSRLAVGAYTDENNGSVYLYQYFPSTWSFTQDTKLQPTDTSRGFFGYSVALREGRLAVGVLGLAVFIPVKGDVFLFERTGGIWPEIARLGPASLDNGDGMGDSVAVGRDFVLSGAPGDDGLPVAPSENRGIAYRFTPSGSSWPLTNTLTPDYMNEAGTLLVTGQAGQRFGAAVAASGDYFAISAPGYHGIGTSTGIVRFYREAPYDRWATASLLPAGKRGINDDPDGDGQPNLIEYAIGSDPLRGTGGGGLSYSLVPHDGATHLQGRLVRPVTPVVRSDISYHFRGGEDLRFPSESNVQYPLYEASEIRAVLRQSVQAAPRGFMHLQVLYNGTSSP